MSFYCFSCQSSVLLSSSGTVGRTESCMSCRADLHCCRNCKFYSESSYNFCSEPQADRVVEKDRSNFCDYFRYREGKSGGVSEAEKQQELKKKLDDLFK